MKRLKIKILLGFIYCQFLLFSFLILYFSFLFSEEIHPNAGTTSANFLKLIPSARAVAFGGAFTGLSDDVYALYFNPAGILQIKEKEVSISHSELYQGLRYNSAGYVFSSGKNKLGFLITGFYTQNDLEKRTWEIEENPYEPLTEPEGYFNAYSIMAQGSFAKSFSEKIFGGLSLKFIHETIDDVSSDSFAVDFGGLYFYKENLVFGSSIKNIGLPMKFIKKEFILPLELNLGVLYKAHRKLKILFDLSQPIDDFLIYRIGVEYYPFDIFSIRVGYNYRLYTEDPLSGTGLGFGVKFHNIYFDYAFLPYNVFGSSHHFSISLKF
ncbi:MAG: PorV/PorQ family protein [Endomicrobiia bacterium]